MNPRTASIASLVSQGLTRRDVEAIGTAVLCAEPGSPAAALRVKVGRAAWPAVIVGSAAEAASAAAERDARLVLVSGTSLDWLLHSIRIIRTTAETPIAVIDADPAAGTELVLLDAGANIVLDRTVSPRELSARLVALVRARSGEERLRVRWLQADELSVDVATRSCTLGDAHLSLSRHDFELLFSLMTRAGRVVRHDELAEQMWEWQEGEDAQNALRLAVARLRKKLGDSSDAPRWIASVRGVGYRFLPPVSEVGDNRNDDRMRTALARLTAQSDALSALADSLAAASTVDAVAETVVSWAVNRGLADACTIFRLERRPGAEPRAGLVASAGMSPRWRQSIASGHPVSSGFLGSRIYTSGETVQLADMSNLAGRFPVTARMSSAEDLHACVMLPLHARGTIWGDLAFLSRSSHSFSPALAGFLRTVSTIVSIALGAVEREEAMADA